MHARAHACTRARAHTQPQASRLQEDGVEARSSRRPTAAHVCSRRMRNRPRSRTAHLHGSGPGLGGARQRITKPRLSGQLLSRRHRDACGSLSRLAVYADAGPGEELAPRLTAGTRCPCGQGDGRCGPACSGLRVGAGQPRALGGAGGAQPCRRLPPAPPPLKQAVLVP